MRKPQTREYRLWSRIKERCYRVKHQHYKSYGARGIRMCDRWLLSFAAFLQDMGPIPEGGTIERIDVNGHYCPENCKWATNIEQQNNKRTNVKLTFNGKTQTAAQWARELGINRYRIYNRLNDGWSHEECLTSPVTANKVRKGPNTWVPLARN